jgi:hypothetical protein
MGYAPVFGYGSGAVSPSNAANGGASGGAGKMNIGVFYIEEGTAIPCTIGAGGITTSQLPNNNATITATDGVITVQEV